MTTAVATVDAGAEVVAELDALADIVEALPPDRWDATSLCAGWRIREVVAHIALPVYHSAPAVVAQLIRSRMRWGAVADRFARRDAERPVADLVSALRSQRLRDWRPPGGGAEGALVHAVVHGLDITVPLGIPRAVPPARMRVALDHLAAPKSLSHFGVDVSGAELRADDVDWRHGAGAVVSCDARSLALALSGRRPLPLSP
jgi:uncharacterized protein (TIGR03083 family)